MRFFLVPIEREHKRKRPFWLTPVNLNRIM